MDPGKFDPNQSLNSLPQRVPNQDQYNYDPVKQQITPKITPNKVAELDIKVAKFIDDQKPPDWSPNVKKLEEYAFVYNDNEGPRESKAKGQTLKQLFKETISSLLNFLDLSGDTKTLKSLQEMRGRLEVENTVKESVEAMKDYRGYRPDKVQVGSLLTIPDNLFVEPKKIKTPGGSKFIHPTAAKTAVKEKTHLNIPDLIVAGLDAKLVPKLFDDKGIVNNQITPTSYILGKPEDENIIIGDGSGKTVPKAEEHLMNVYVLDLGPKQVVIRSGVINTEEKKNDFVKLIKEIHTNHAEEYKKNTGKDLKLRVVSQQLNSFEVESKMIQDQHYMISQANKDLKEIAEVIHMNVPSNRWYHMTEWISSLGMIGKMIKYIAPKNFLQGEKLSKDLNASAMGTYLNWVTDDVSELGLLDTDMKEWTDALVTYKNLRSSCQSKMDEAVGEIYKLKSTKPITRENQTKIKAQEEILRETRKTLKGLLKEEYKTLAAMENEYFSSVSFSDYEDAEKKSQIKDKMQTVSLMRQVLGSQLGIDKESLDRGKEGMALQLLNDKLGVISAINCKSGLDRTGIWHAIKLGMLTFEKKLENEDGSTRAFNLVNDWEKTSSLLNMINANSSLLHAGEILKQKDTTELLKQLQLPPDTNQDELDAIIKQLIDVLNFRNEVLNHLITIGIPITTTSTGVMGFKWNTGHEENLIPLNFLPSHVKSSDGNLIPLVKYNAKGEAIGITKKGAALLTKHQKLRGS